MPLPAELDSDLLEPGNINLGKRPRVKNKDGSISTVRSITVEMDGHHILIPTVIGTQVVSDDEAIRHFRQTSQHLGIYKSAKAANKAAAQLHKDQAKFYGL
jgi:hypothetical protein